MKVFQWTLFALALCSFTVAKSFYDRQAPKPATVISTTDSLTVDSVAAQPYKLVEDGYRKTGSASYYSGKFHGRKTASGELFHKDSLTAAHRTLPFGTLLRITNLTNDSVIVVRVTDRMGRSNHMIDLSEAGAKRLNFKHAGIAKVRIEQIERSAGEEL